MNPDRFTLEVCIATLDDALAASEGGANRLELNSALALGGLTPSPGALLEVIRSVDLPVIAMIRPRPGGFCYSDASFRTMRADIDWVLSHGASGIAIGLLNADGRVDVSRCREIREKTAGYELVFHRAFDITPDPFEALDQLIDLGFNRILTSGHQPTSLAGATLLSHLMTRAAGRIGLIGGGGVSAHVLAEIVALSGCAEFHGSFRKSTVDPSMQVPSAQGFEEAFGSSDGHFSGTDAATVRVIRALLDSLRSSPDEDA